MGPGDVHDNRPDEPACGTHGVRFMFDGEDHDGKPCVECVACLLLQKDELLKAADALLGKMGGPNSPVQPVYEDEFVALELLVDRLNGNDPESIDKRKDAYEVPSGEILDGPAGPAPYDPSHSLTDCAYVDCLICFPKGTVFPHGTYKCPICGKDTPHTHDDRR